MNPFLLQNILTTYLLKNPLCFYYHLIFSKKKKTLQLTPICLATTLSLSEILIEFVNGKC